MNTKELANECVKELSCDLCIYVHECNRYRELVRKAISKSMGKYNLLLPSDLNGAIDRLVDILHEEL